MIRFLERASQDKGVDLEAWESALRTAVLKAGASVLEALLHGVGCGRRAQGVLCQCGGAMKSVGLREKRVHTILGPLLFRRSLYLCPECGCGRFPGDETLGITGTKFSPGLRRMMARAGSRTSFGEAEEDLRVYGAVEVDRKEIERVAKEVGRQIERWMAGEKAKAIRQAGRDTAEQSIPVFYVSFDGTGVPMRAKELRGRKGKQPDGSARTREVKVGCVFTQTTIDQDNRPVRDPDSTTYTAAIESSDEFGRRIYAEALMRGLEQAKKVVVLTDGARYNKSITQMHFATATHIIDLYHAREHLHILSKLLLPDTNRKAKEKPWLELLDEGQIEALMDAIKRYLPSRGHRRKKALKEINYFLDNAEKMRYADFKKQGLFVGSGVIEAGCRTLIGQRLKKSGMFWSLDGANAIIASRCCQLSGRFENFWEEMAA